MRRRPNKHTKTVHTKRGRRRVVVNPHIMHKELKEHKKNIREKGTIKKDERKIFNLMSDPKKYNKEFGGAIDFDMNGDIERIDVHPGQEMSVDLPTDYEVQYHTHPDANISPPTPEDVMAIISNKRQQAELVIRDGKTFTLVKTPLTRALSKLPATKLQKKLDRAFSISRNSADFEKEWKNNLEDLGFLVYQNNNPNSPLSIHVHPVEPRKRRRHT